GWSVIPVYEIAPSGTCACGQATNQPGHKAGKHPRTPHGVKDATTSEAIIHSWVSRWPTTNIAVATGSPSGLIVLDIDPRNGRTHSLAELERKQGPLPPTVEVRTGGGGRHLYFECAGDVKIPNRTHLGGYRGLDLKGEGGYVVAPPSNHVSGGSYQWEPGRGPDEIPLAPLPEFLLDLAGSDSGNGRVRYDAVPWDGALPQPVRDLIDGDPRIRARFERNSKGLSDQSDSGVDQSLASLLARNDVSATDIEGGLRASRAAARLGERPRTYYDATVGKAVEAAKNRAATRSAKRPAAPLISAARPPLPAIVINNRPPRDVIGDAWSALLPGSQGDLFNWHGQLVRLVQGDSGLEVALEAPDALNGRLLRAADWFYVTQRGRYHRNSPPYIGRDMLVNPDPRVPKFESIANAPFFLPDGQLIVRPGLHPGSGIYLAPVGLDGLPEVPAAPSREEVAGARALILEELLVDFPFVADADRAHAVAAMLLSHVRTLIEGPTPGNLYEAPTPGSGK